jgi:non-ribosomal peptide synthetase component F
VCIQELFEQQPERTPGAVEHEGGSLSYRELNEQADRLADQLIADLPGGESACR